MKALIVLITVLFSSLSFASISRVDLVTKVMKSPTVRNAIDKAQKHLDSHTTSSDRILFDGIRFSDAQPKCPDAYAFDIVFSDHLSTPTICILEVVRMTQACGEKLEYIVSPMKCEN